MKNIEIVTILERLGKIEGLKFGGVKLKIILKNKKTLVQCNDDLNEVRKKLVEQYTTDGKLDELTATEEWKKLLMEESFITLDKVFDITELDQFSDLTLEQYEILELMSK